MSLVCPVNNNSIEQFRLLAQSLRLYAQDFKELIFITPDDNSALVQVIRNEMAIFGDSVAIIDCRTLFNGRKWPLKYDVVLASEVVSSEYYLVLTSSCVLTRSTHSGEKGGWGAIGWYKTKVVRSYLPTVEEKNFPPLDVLYRSGATHKLVHNVESCTDTMVSLDKVSRPIIHISNKLKLPVTMKKAMLHKHLQLPRNKKMVSCLMVTKNRHKQVKNSVQCYLNQTYDNRELVVVCDDDRQTQQYIQSLDRPDIRFIDVDPSPDLTLGKLRNIAIENAHGHYITQWDDDDWYNPARIMTQVMLLEEAKVDIILLGQWVAVWPDQKKYTLSFYRRDGWEGSMLMIKDKAVKYEELRKAEDTKFIAALRKNKLRFFVTNPPQYALLYVYNVHDTNTWTEEHFTSLFSNSYDIASLSGDSFRAASYAEELAKAVQQEYIGYETTNYYYNLGEKIAYMIMVIAICAVACFVIGLFYRTIAGKKVDDRPKISSQ